MKPFRVILGLFLVLATACTSGGGSKVATLGADAASSSSASSEAAKQDFRDALLDYSQCMRDHGIDMPDPTFDDSGGEGGFAIVGPGGAGGKMPDPNSAEFKAAEEACKPILDAAEKNFKPLSPEEEAEMRDKALAFAQCMRDHGIDMPDPTFDGAGGFRIQEGDASGTESDDETTADVGPSPDDPKFQEAAKACAPEDGKGPGFRTQKMDGDG